MIRKYTSFLSVFLLLFFIQFTAAQPAGSGKVAGTIVDAANGDPLIGANIYLENTSLGAASDLNGKYIIENVPQGNHTLIVSIIGYAEIKVNNLQVKQGETTSLNLSAKSEILTTDVVVVEAKAVQNTEASLLKARQKSLAVSDAVSAEAISKAGSGNAAEAMKQVTGASVVGGKYVYVRGLGDRYTSTQLNGAELPSTDPAKRAASIDIIPTNLIDNIQTVKSFTPDKPGNFSGGTVDIKTKDFPEDFNFSFSMSSSYNSQTTFNDNGPLSHSGGNLDWLGMDDGSRELPDVVRNKDVYIPDVAEAGQDLEKAVTLDKIVKGFNPEIAPSKLTPMPNQNYSLSLGNQIQFLNRPLGYIASLTYGRSISSYSDGSYQRWDIGNLGSQELQNDYRLNDSKTTDEVLWGALLKTSYKLSNNHIISMNGMYNQNGESTTRYLTGSYPYDLDPTSTWIGSVLAYKERNLKSFQMNGEHNLSWLFDTRIEWKGSLGTSNQDEPDLRYFNSFKNKNNLYGIKANIPPARYWRSLEEDRQEFKLDITLPFKQWAGHSGSIKFGGLTAKKDRNHTERHFEYKQDPVFNYLGSEDTLFAENNVGLIDTTKRTIAGVTYRRYDFGLVIRENYFPQGNYIADQNISAGYLMIDLPLFSKLRLIGGARFETTDMFLETEAKNTNRASYKTDDILPSANLIYSLQENMNIRLGFNRTLARPMFREVAPYASWDFQGGNTYIGNPDVSRTLIDNADLRWEWFSRPGEIYAVSAFWKSFKNPIEEVFNTFGEITWMNMDKASVYGLELEARKKLDIISPYLADFSIGTNLSLVESKVEIPDTLLFLRKQTRPDAANSRPFQGQSPYLFNLNVNYDNLDAGMSASIYYNIFGKRLNKVSLGGTPDIYEQPFGMLNFSLGWELIQNVKFKFSAKNILNDEIKMTHSYRGKEYIHQAYKVGRSFSIGLGYSI